MRNIGIVADGATDYQIFSRFIQCLLLNGGLSGTRFNVYKLRRQTLRDYVDRYWTSANKTKRRL